MAAPTGGKMPWQGRLARVLLAPARAYHWALYTCRLDTQVKTREGEWAKLGSQWRFAQALVAYVGPPGHVLWRIKFPLLANLAVMGLTLLDAFAAHPHAVVTHGVNVAMSLAFRLSAFMLALLLSWRVNRAYERWWAARQAYSGVGSAALSVAQMATLWVRDAALRDELLRWSKVWQFSAHQFLTRGPLHPQAAALLSAQELQLYGAARKPRNLLALRMHQLAGQATCLSVPQALQLDQAIAAGISAQGSCARIFMQAMPYGLTLFCTGFLEIWLLLMPFALVEDATPQPLGHPRLSGWLLLVYGLISVLMLGVDELANQLEPAFPAMPLLDIASSTLSDICRVQQQAEALDALGRAGAARRCQADPEEAAGDAGAAAGLGHADAARGHKAPGAWRSSSAQPKDSGGTVLAVPD